MLEKIGLPPKPSLRGNTWVVDASHCQGCSSQFSFINRKHHCRRCGGIFCGSCTQQRMVLRGQGDSPVRICEPCKKLEEAARFEMRYGNKTRAAKGISKYGSKKEDEVLDQILGNEEKINPMQNASASCSNIQEVATQFDGGDIVRNLSLNQNTDILTEVASATPEDLRQQSLAEKNKYRTLKAEGKSDEALKAFKRGKELERQASALEISIRKNRKKALSSTNTEDTQESKDDSKASPDKIKLPKQKTKETNDLSSELKELGWSDLDIRDAEKKPATSVEGELSSLLREVSQKPNKEKRVGSSEKSSQVIAHKKKALELKRAGNLLEAKEELKRAKVLERKIEEEELLGGSDESDDELSSLIRDMDSDDKKGDIFAEYEPDLNIDLDHFSGIADHIAVDGNFEVTDEDMNDPEIASALQSFGWDEDTPDPEIASFDRESSIAEIRSLKREALNQKRAGNTAEAMTLLKKAKLLEKELEDSDTRGSDLINMEPDIIKEVTGPKLAPKSKLVIQRELIALKKKALTLKREGKVDESEEELKKAKALEEQLEDMNKAAPAPSVTQPIVVNRHIYDNVNDTLGNGDEEGEEVTDQDLQDPAYVSLLKNLGWDEEDKAEVPSTTSKENNRPSKYTKESSITQSVTNVEEATKSRKSKSEIQRELLQLKRKALTLRRQGEADEADEVLKMARLLEAQLEEYEKPSQAEDPPKNNQRNASIDALQSTESSSLEAIPQVKDNVTLEKPNVIVHKNEKPFIQELQSSPATISSSLQQEILAHKRKAVAFKRDGKLAEAKEELRQAKLLEKSMENNNEPPTSTNSSDDIVASVAKEASPSSVSKPLSSRDRFKLQQESLAHKRKALKLRREGKTAEADAEFELAKAIESQLQELDSSDSAVGGDSAGDVSVEDFLDPQLLSALRSVGLEDGQTKSSQVVVERPDLTKFNTDANVEREQLVEQIKAEKVKALNLKRSGKSAEALDALRQAKLYEKKLQTLTSK